MARGDTSLASREYDQWLSQNKNEKELLKRKQERKSANKGYEGYHFGIDSKPVYTRDKEEFRRELDKRGLMMADDVRQSGHMAGKEAFKIMQQQKQQQARQR